MSLNKLTEILCCLDGCLMFQIPKYSNYYITQNGEVWSEPRKTTRGGWLHSFVDIDGYKYINLYINGKPRKRAIHHLVLESWVCFRPKNKEACHYDGNKLNNNLSNLRWDTRSNNIKDSIKHGTHPNNIGEKNGQSKLKEQDVRMIIYMYRTKEFTQQEIADIYNVSYACINLILNKKNWRHIWS